LGINGIFSGPLPRMSTNPEACVTAIYHKAVCIVNEEGTEAAAVTAVSDGSCDESESETFNMVCDRPFLFWIREKKSKQMLFVGRIDEPEEP